MIELLTHTALDGTAHGFFTRQGGVSTDLYESLNVGLGSDDAHSAYWKTATACGNISAQPRWSLLIRRIVQ